MQLSYDSRYNIAYIRFQPKISTVESVRISDELVIDMTPDGKVYGIELLNAAEQLQKENAGKFLIINEATHEQVAVSLPV